jgi:hypothetical protein
VLGREVWKRMRQGVASCCAASCCVWWWLRGKRRSHQVTALMTYIFRSNMTSLCSTQLPPLLSILLALSSSILCQIYAASTQIPPTFPTLSLREKRLDYELANPARAAPAGPALHRLGVRCTAECLFPTLQTTQSTLSLPKLNRTLEWRRA